MGPPEKKLGLHVFIVSVSCKGSRLTSTPNRSGALQLSLQPEHTPPASGNSLSSILRSNPPRLPQLRLRAYGPTKGRPRFQASGPSYEHSVPHPGSRHALPRRILLSNFWEVRVLTCWTLFQSFPSANKKRQT